MNGELIKNIRKVFSGTFLSGIIGLITWSIMAKFTNNLMFGYFAVIQTLVYFVDALVNFQSWQAVTRFAHVLNCNDRKRLYNLCFKVDFITAMMAFVICNIITYFFSKYFGIPSELYWFCLIYSFLILFNVSGVQLARLRINNEFHKIRDIQLFVSLLKVIFISLFCYIGMSDFYIFISFLFFESLFHVLIICQGFKTKDSFESGGWEVFSKKNVIRFMMFTNLSGSIRLACQELDVIVLSSMLGPVIAGKYKIMKKYLFIVYQVTDSFQGVLYPKISSLINNKNKNEARKLVIRFGGGLFSIVFIMFLIALIAVPVLLPILSGIDNRDFYYAFYIYLISICIYSGGICFRPVVLSFNHPGYILFVYIIATVVAFIPIHFLIIEYGVIGVASIQVIFQIVWFMLMFIKVKRLLLC